MLYKPPQPRGRSRGRSSGRRSRKKASFAGLLLILIHIEIMRFKKSGMKTGLTLDITAFLGNKKALFFLKAFDII